MNLKFMNLLFVLLAASTCPIRLASAADPDRQSLRAGITVGDGKNGRVFAKWQEQLADRPVETISVRLQKRSGGNDAYINLRFGAGQVLENGRRVYLTDGGAQTVTWNAGGIRSGGQPLVLMAYNGEVDVTSAEVQYSPSTRGPEISGPHYDRRDDTDWSNSHRNDDRYDDGSRPHDGWRTPHGGNEDDDRYDDRRDDYDDHWDGTRGHPPGGYGGNGDRGAFESCRQMRIRAPRIEIGRVRPTGGLFSGKYKLDGAVAGICIEEAGYYEKGRLKEKFNIPLSDRFLRVEFDLTVRSGERGEIRVFTSDGRAQSMTVDEAVQRYQP